MRFDLYYQNNTNGSSPDVANANNIPFNDIIAGEHSRTAFCIKPVATTETTLSSVAFYLESLDTLDAEIGFYKSNSYAQQIPNNSNLSAIHLVEQPNAQKGDPNGQALTVIGANQLPFIWLDCEVASNQREVNTSTYKKRFDLNFRLIYDFT